MTRALLIACITILTWGAVSLLGSLLVAALWRVAPVRARLAQDTGALVALRLLPSALALLAALGVMLPAFVIFEPGNSAERVTPLMALLAFGSLFPAGFGAWRVVGVALASRRFGAERSAASRAIRLEGAAVPAFVVDDSWGGVAVAGFFRTRLLIARRVLERLSAEELSAVVAHENEHARRSDNLRRLVMRCAPDWLTPTAVSDTLERAFTEAAERQADAGAARRGPKVALALASALVAVARLVPTPPDAVLASPLHSGSGGALTRRIRALTAPAAYDRASVVSGTTRWAFVSLVLAFVTALAVALQPGTLLAVHAAGEVVVRLLL